MKASSCHLLASGLLVFFSRASLALAVNFQPEIPLYSLPYKALSETELSCAYFQAQNDGADLAKSELLAFENFNPHARCGSICVAQALLSEPNTDYAKMLTAQRFNPNTLCAPTDSTIVYLVSLLAERKEKSLQNLLQTKANELVLQPRFRFSFKVEADDFSLVSFLLGHQNPFTFSLLSRNLSHPTVDFSDSFSKTEWEGKKPYAVHENLAIRGLNQFSRSKSMCFDPSEFTSRLSLVITHPTYRESRRTKSILWTLLLHFSNSTTCNGHSEFEKQIDLVTEAIEKKRININPDHAIHLVNMDHQLLIRYANEATPATKAAYIRLIRSIVKNGGNLGARSPISPIQFAVNLGDQKLVDALTKP